MQFEEAYLEDRLVTCDQCGFDGEIEIPIVAYATVEIGEWECPKCEAFHDYQNDTIWDMADKAHDRMREGW
jgi:predicted nucleic-acid-binding Zn-ribbon protein